MCLSCIDIGEKTKEEIKNTLEGFRNIIRLPNNDFLELNVQQTNEIIENALVVISTGVDLGNSIWAIQWPRDYKVKTIFLN